MPAALPFKTIAKIANFVADLRAVAVAGIEKAKREIEYAEEELISGDERHWRAEEIFHRGILAACDAIQKGIRPK